MTDDKNISIGLIGTDRAWTMLLDQIGVPWSSLNAAEQDALSATSAVIVNRMLTAAENKTIEEYLYGGGAVLFTPSERNRVFANAAEYRRCSSLPPVQSDEYSFTDMFDLNMIVYRFRGGRLIASERTGKGIVSYCGLDAEEYFADGSSCRKNFYADRTPMPSEIVSGRSKRAFRQIIHSHLEYLHHQRNLPFAHKWYSPDPHAPVFLHRIDTDKGSREQIDEIHQLSRTYSIPTTWFLDVKSHESWIEYFRTFETQEIGVHCYEHLVHSDEEENRKNFHRALAILKGHGWNPSGIAAPTGAWNEAIGGAFRQLHFLYSSEFSYDYDNLPSYPSLSDSVSPVLQVPIHPICIGSMKREHMTDEEMVRYFISVINHQLHLREPISLYHHPTHGKNDVFRAVFDYLRHHPVTPMRFEDFARWWKVRQSVRLNVRTDGRSIGVTMNGQTTDVPVRIILPDGREFFCANEMSVDSTQAGERPVIHPSVRPARFADTRAFTLRHLFHNTYDWWIKTTE